LERAVKEGVHALVDVFAQLAHRALADARQPHRLHEVIDLARGHAADPGFLDHRDERALAGLAGFQEGREVGRAAAQLRDAQLQCS